MENTERSWLIWKFQSLEIVLKIMFLSFVVIVGGMTNMGVIISNQGKMPIRTDYYIDSDVHFAYQDFDEVNHPFFTDIIPIGNIMMSIGDLIIIFGSLGMIYFLIYGIYHHFQITERRFE